MKIESRCLLISKYNPFLSKEWQNAWYKHFGRGRKLYEFQIGNEYLLIIKMMPLINIFCNGGINLTNKIETKNAGLFLDRIQSYIKRGVLVLYDVPEDGTLAAEISRRNAYRIRSYQAARSKFSDSFELFMSNQFNSKRRNNLRSYENRLGKVGSLVFKIHRSEETFTAAEIESFFEIWRERFHQKKIRNRYLDSVGEAFVKDIMSNMKSVGILITEMKLDQLAISFNVLFEYNDEVILSFTTFDAAFRKFSLGNTAIYRTAEFVNNCGYNVFDFSKGVSLYKEKWTNNTYWLSTYVLPLSSRFNDILLAKLVTYKMSIKSKLREMGFGKLYKKLIFKLKDKEKRGVGKNRKRYTKEQFDFKTFEGHPWEMFSYRLIRDLPLELRTEIMDEVFVMLGKNDELKLIRTNADISISDNQTVVRWRLINDK